MNIQKKRILFIMAVVFAVFVLLLTTGGIVLEHMDITSVTDQALQALSSGINGRITYRSAELRIFPFPRLMLEGANLALADTAAVAVDQVRIYPKFSSLIRGKIRPGSIRLDIPRLIVDAAPFYAKNSFKDGGAAIRALLSRLRHSAAEKSTEIRVVCRRGEISIIEDDQQVYWVSAIDADVRLGPGKIRIAAQARSSQWRQAGLDIEIDPDAGMAGGWVHVEDFFFERPIGRVTPLTGLPVSRLRTDFHLNFDAPAPGSFSGDIQGRIPELTIAKENTPPVLLAFSRFKGSFQVDGTRIRAVADDLSTDSPSAAVKGFFDWNKPDGQAVLEIDGSVEDVSAAREVALALLGRFKTTRRLFAIIRDGSIPRISIKMMADSPKNFKKAENIFLSGKLVSGNIVTPGPALELEDVFGEVVLSKGTLQGKDIRGRLGNSTGTEGNFSIGMIGPTANARVETRIHADLSQLPAILARLIPNQAFRREMDKLRNTTGSAQGKLVLDGPRNAIQPRVEVDAFTLKTEYDRAPFPLRAAGGKFLYDSRQIDLRNVRAGMGSSRISGLHATLHWKDTPTVRGVAENGVLAADELYPWMLAAADPGHYAGLPAAVCGEVHLSHIEIQGPFFHPDRWRFTASGFGEDVEISTADLPDSPLRIQGPMTATNDRLAFQTAVLSYRDIVMGGSFEMTRALNAIESVTAEFYANFNPQSLQPALSAVRLPFAPSGSEIWEITNGRAVWRPGENITFRGAVAIPEGPEILLDLCRDQDMLAIEQMQITGDDSVAEIVLHQTRGDHDIRFSGRLGQSVTARFLPFSPEVSGDFRIRLRPGSVESIDFTGHAVLTNVALSRVIDFPIDFQKISITQGSHRPFIQAAGQMNGGQPFQMAGEVDTGADPLFGRFDIHFEALDLNAVVARILDMRTGEHHAHGPFYPFNAAWELNLTADQVSFGNFSWDDPAAAIHLSPDQMDVAISQARLCGIDIPGTLALEPDGMQVNLTPRAEKFPMGEMVPCLGGKSGLIRGDVDITAAVSAQGAYEELIPSLAGDFKLVAPPGRIYRFSLMSKIFAILNITEIFRGTLPDLTNEGFQYKRIEVAGRVSGEKIHITRAVIDGDAMDMLFEGELNVDAGTMDIILLVAPLKTVDFIVKKTPIVNDILDGSLVTIAIAIKGDIADPELTPLPPAAIGGGLLKILENTLKLPVKILQPVIDATKEENDGHSDREN